jgi:hypothetical protein
MLHPERVRYDLEMKKPEPFAGSTAQLPVAHPTK